MLLMMAAFAAPPVPPRPRREGPRTITVPAHHYTAGTSGIVHTAAVGGLMLWVEKLVKACFVASMIATGVLLFTHFTARWTASGYPSIPIAALTPVLAGQSQQPSVPIAGNRPQPRHAVHTSARPTSNFAQYEG